MGQPEVIFLLIHGTWGRNTRRGKPLWFQSNSKFRNKLTEEFSSENVAFKFMLWSGKNTFADRLRAVEKLKRRISHHLDVQCGSKLVVIAHSHGGNIVLKALSDLSPSADGVKCVTLATPFLKVFINKEKRRFQVSSLYLSFSLASVSSLGLFLIWYADSRSTSNNILLTWMSSSEGLYSFISLIVSAYIVISSSISLKNVSRISHQKKLIKLPQSYNYKFIKNHLLVLRGVHDEAALIIALSNTLSYLSLALNRLIPIVSISLIVLSIIVCFFMYLFIFSLGPALLSGLGRFIWDNQLYYLITLPAALAYATVLIRLVDERTKLHVFGDRDISKSDRLEVDLSVVPDTNGPIEIVTLSPRNVKNLRHGIYDYIGVERKIIDWLLR